MTNEIRARANESSIPVIDLSRAPGERAAWDKPRAVVYLWSAMELLFVTNPWQVSSYVRVKVLRLFGAEIGKGVIFRPRTRVKFPWKLSIGDRSWIGEGVWIHNQDHVYLGSDVVISQETFITTGSHSHRTDMGLVTTPIRVENGTWVTSRCMVLGGTTLGRSCLVLPMSVVRGQIPANQIVSGNPAVPTGQRFKLQ
jgi:putative colanic acid biosynthesis acetyltransferase WcaF